MSIPSDTTIGKALSCTVEHLRSHELDQAKATLTGLDFERLLCPRVVRQNGQRMFMDPAEEFGSTRVNQTADYLRACEEAVSCGDVDRAFYAAVAAMLRWKEDKPPVARCSAQSATESIARSA